MAKRAIALSLLTALGLQFSSSNLEKRYSKMKTATFVKFDWCFVVIYVSFWGMLCYRASEATWDAVSKLCCWCHLIGVLFYYWILLRRNGSRCRTVVVIVYRGLILPLTSAVLFPIYFSKPVTGFTSFARWAFQSTSLINSAASPVMMPVLFKYQILVQGVSFLFKAVVNTPNACRVATQTSIGIRHVSQTWSKIERAVWRVLSIMYLTDFKGHSEADPLAACRQLLSWLYLMVSLVLPLSILWVVEYWSRVRFLEALRCNQTAIEELQNWPKLRQMWYHALFVVVFAAISWEALSGRFDPSAEHLMVLASSNEGDTTIQRPIE